MTTKAKLHIDTSGQLDFFAQQAEEERLELSSRVKSGMRHFISPDSSKITIGNSLLQEHLVAAGQKLPFVLSEVLEEQDYSEFESQYDAKGRTPYSPRCMIGIILYCIMQGVTSLRGVEKSARLDLGCMWVSGGIMPDHASVGRFINIHSETLSDSFFTAIVLTTLKKTGSDIKRLAGDGTVVEAACSHYKLYKSEALKIAAEEAKEELRANPDNEEAIQKAERFEVAVKEVNRRDAIRRRARRQISVLEPEAMLQRAKRGRGFMSSYKPSVLTNEQRVVVAKAVSPAMEAGVIPDMLEETKRLNQSKTEELLLDAGYCTEGVIEASLEHDISLLCPDKTETKRPGNAKYFLKESFNYDEDSDCYVCPAGQKLTYKGIHKGGKARVFGDALCDSCTLKSQCTPSKRSIRRFRLDEQKDALKLVMGQPKAQEIYGKRQGMVEPVFSYMRLVQGLNRFRRKGLTGVCIEFSLHMLAYNISRVVALQ